MAGIGTEIGIGIGIVTGTGTATVIITARTIPDLPEVRRRPDQPQTAGVQPAILNGMAGIGVAVK
jgi:hypothetical protein